MYSGQTGSTYRANRVTSHCRVRIGGTLRTLQRRGAAQNKQQLYDSNTVFRGGFRISLRGWQSNLQGVAKISQWVAKKLRATPQRFLLSYTTLLIYTHFLTFLTCYKKLHEIYFFTFLFVFYLLYASLIPRNVLGLGGGLKPLQIVATPETLRGWRLRGGPRHPPEIASDFIQKVTLWIMDTIQGKITEGYWRNLMADRELNPDMEIVLSFLTQLAEHRRLRFAMYSSLNVVLCIIIISSLRVRI